MSDCDRIELDLTHSLVAREEMEAFQEGLDRGEALLASGKEDYTGWFTLPYAYDKEEIGRIKAAAKRIQSQCQALVVIGIGGSYLGARAAIELLGRREGAPEIYFAGHNISGTYHVELMQKIQEKELCLCVISKSGTTTEPSIAFALLKDLMYRKYDKEEAGRRIYAITDREKGVLRKETDEEGYESFVVPDDIGGRYSVLTPVGLLPIAAAGIDIDAMLAGAGEEVPEQARRYAAVRNVLLARGKTVEVFECYEPRLQFFTEWLKQLFGESEGKEGKGIFPAALQFSTDLHSMGQFLQEGSPIVFETVLDILEPPADITVPESAGGLLAGKSMNQVNRAAVAGVTAAHAKAGVPIVSLRIPAMTPRYFGQMVQFFERACALSGYLLGVTPFDQPGVEQYKSEMRKALESL